MPDNPAAWLHTTARYLAVERIRRRDTHRNKVRLVAATSPQVVEDELTEHVDGDLADDLLGLIFMAAHPILSPDARSALTLKLVCGLDTEDIARAFLEPTATIAQRVVRANGPCRRRTSGSSSPAQPNGPDAWLRCTRSSTSSSTRGTRLRAGTRGCAPTCARRRCGWAACWPA